MDFMDDGIPLDIENEHDDGHRPSSPGVRGPHNDLIVVKRQIQQYLIAKERDEVALQEAKAEMEILKKRIVELQVCFLRLAIDT